MSKAGRGAIGIAAYVLTRFAAIAMQHPDWKMDDWVGFLGFVPIAAAQLTPRLQWPERGSKIQIDLKAA